MDSDLLDAPFYFALDQGSHASRAIVFSHKGQSIAQAYQNIHVSRPADGYAEYDPEELLASVDSTVRSAMSQLGDRPIDIVAAGLSTQRSTIACWDRGSGEALAPIISWQDRRAHQMVAGLESQADQIHRTTGLILTPYYGASKLRWCLDHVPEVARAFEEKRLCFGPLSSFLLFRFLDEHPYVVDPTNSSRTQLWSLEDQNWDPYLLDLFGVPGGILPRCVPTRFEFGHLKVGQRRIPLRVCTGDQSAAIYAYGPLDPETAYINLGTGAFVSRPIVREGILAPRLLTGVIPRSDSERHYVLEGTVNGAGGALSLVAEQLRVDFSPETLNTWIQEVEDPPLFLNGVSGLGSPFWVPNFPSQFVGNGTGIAKIVAVAESIVFLVRANLDEMNESVPPPERLFVTGGLGAIDGLCQCLADVTGVSIYRPGECEATARGTAFLLAGQPHRWPESAPGSSFKPRGGEDRRRRYLRWLDFMLLTINRNAE